MTTQSPKPIGWMHESRIGDCFRADVEMIPPVLRPHWQPVYSEATVRELESKIEALESQAKAMNRAVNALSYTANYYRRALDGASPQWLPIETAPKDGSLFLCWVLAVHYGEADEGQQYQVDVSQADFCHWQSHDDAPNGGWFEPCCGQIGDGQDVTHWMPIPAAPSPTTTKE